MHNRNKQTRKMFLSFEKRNIAQCASSPRNDGWLPHSSQGISIPKPSLRMARLHGVIHPITITISGKAHQNIEDEEKILNSKKAEIPGPA